MSSDSDPGPRAGTLSGVISVGLRRAVDSSGRSGVLDFWVPALVVGGVGSVLTLIAKDMERSSALFGLVLLALFLVWFLVVAGVIRRLHDTSRSGSWVFVGMIPVVGQIALFVLLISPSTPAENAYGPPPQRSRA